MCQHLHVGSVLKATIPWVSSTIRNNSPIRGRNQEEVCGDPLRTSFTIATNRGTDCLVVFLVRNISGLMSWEDKFHVLDMQTHAKHSAPTSYLPLHCRERSRDQRYLQMLGVFQRRLMPHAGTLMKSQGVLPKTPWNVCRGSVRIILWRGIPGNGIVLYHQRIHIHQTGSTIYLVKENLMEDYHPYFNHIQLLFHLRI